VTNRIHEQDVAAAIVASMLHDAGNRAGGGVQIFNLADDLPESRHVVMEHAVRLLQGIGAKVPATPTRADEDGSGRSKRRIRDRKRVSNEKMKAALVPALRYPTYREGLAHILTDPDAPWKAPSPS
jgi:hypothetical protein